MCMCGRTKKYVCVGVHVTDFAACVDMLLEYVLHCVHMLISFCDSVCIAAVKGPRAEGFRAVVVAPTRELSQQV